jgi:hypothetical protein
MFDITASSKNRLNIFGIEIERYALVWFQDDKEPINIIHLIEFLD